MEEEKEQKSVLRLVQVHELENWIETIRKLLLKKHAIKGSKRDRFNWLVHAYLAQIKMMGCNIDFRNLDTLTINGIKYVKSETK